MFTEVECLNCQYEFAAQMHQHGSCPQCGKTFTWDSAGEGKDEYWFPDWEPAFLPEFVIPKISK